jgi:hypothetical protein
MKSNLNSKIIHDKIDNQPRPEEGRKEEARRKPIPVKEDQIGHYLDRKEEMQAKRMSRNKMENPILRQLALKWPTEKRREVEEDNNMEEDKKEEQREKEDFWLKGGREEDNKRY